MIRRTPGRHRIRSLRARPAVAALAALGLILASALVAAPPGQADTPLGPGSVKVTVLTMTPTTPAVSSDAEPIVFRLRIENTTAQTLTNVSLDADRDTPTTDPKQLSALIADPKPADSSLLQSLKPRSLSPLAPHQIVAVEYQATTSNNPSTSDICLCLEGIYPIDFTVRAALNQGAAATDVGFAQTYLPSFPPSFTHKPVQVTWIWPLIDRPHRVSSTTVFTDDDLAAEVASGGRLDRALQVVEKVTAAKVRLTLVIDPELIEELSIMATGHYQVRTAAGTLLAGTRGAVAQAFLSRLTALAPLVDVSLTPYADPDIDSLSDRGLPWSASLDASPQDETQPSLDQTQVQVVGVLGTATHDDFLWPAGQAITAGALDQVTNDGTSTILLDDKLFAKAGALDAIAPISPGTGTTAVLTDDTLQKLASSVISRDTGPALAGGADVQALPILVSDLAVRALADPTHSHYVALAADRYVDPDVQQSVRAIEETATATWSVPLNVHDATSTVTAVDHGALSLPASDPSPLPGELLDALANTSHFVRTFSSALADPADEAKLIDGLPYTIAWGGSNAWSADPEGGAAYTSALNQVVTGWQDGVYIARPSNGSYTLASSNAPLFVTVINSLPYAMKVQVSLEPVNGAAGFYADPVGTTVPSHGRQLLKVAAHVQRAGRFQIMATVTTADGTSLGQPIALSVRSTALGAVGVIITITAGAMLLLLLLLRLIRRIRRGAPPPRRGNAFRAAARDARDPEATRA